MIGGGKLESSRDDHFRLEIPASKRYANAQLDDYRRLPRARFPWKPPVLFHLRARASHSVPKGTLGFGFWNDPFALSLGQRGAERRFPSSPEAVWFFHGSHPNDLAFVPDVPGHGWKASCLDSPPIPMLLLAPLAACAVLMAQVPGLRSPVIKLARRAISASETLLPVALDEWHTYALQWEPEQAVFSVDGQSVLRAPAPPTGPLGFVAWIDNQYAIASPEGGFRFGVVPTGEAQWLELADFHCQRG